MKTFKSVFALILVFCMLCSLATAAFADGDTDGGQEPPPAEGAAAPAPVAGESGPAPVAGESGPVLTEGGSGPAPVAPVAGESGPVLTEGAAMPSLAKGGSSGDGQQPGEEPKDVTAEWTGQYANHLYGSMLVDDDNNPNTSPILVVPENVLLQDLFSPDEVDINNGYIWANGGTVGENNGVIQGVGLRWSFQLVYTHDQLELGDDPLMSPSNIGEYIITTNYGTVVTNNGLIGNYETTAEGNLMTAEQAISIYEKGWSLEYNKTPIVMHEGTLCYEKEEKQPDGQIVKIYPPVGDELKPDDIVLVKEHSGLYQQRTIVYDENGNPVPDPDSGNLQIVETNAPGGVISANTVGAVGFNGNEEEDSYGHRIHENTLKPVSVAFPGYVINNEGTILKNNYGYFQFNSGDVESRGVVVTNAATGTINVNEGIVGAHLVDQNRNPLYDENGMLIPGNSDTPVYRGYNTDREMILYFKRADYGYSKVNLSDLNVEDDGTSGNWGAIGTNTETGIILHNHASGTVGENSGAVYENEGKVVTNLDGGVVDNCEGGIVIDNKGQVYNYGGTVQGGTGTEFFTVDVNATNARAALGTGFTSHNEKNNWLGSNQTASVTITPDPEYFIDSIETPDGITATKNNDGTWTLTITNPFSHIRLSPVASLITQPGTPTSTTSTTNPGSGSKSGSVTITVEYTSVSCTFNLDGGTLNGQSGPVVKWFAPGTTVKLPAAPTKAGFTFAGWQTKIGGEVKVFQAGEKFTVTGAQNFTALWE